MIGRGKKATKPKISEPTETMSLTDHLRELRSRLVKSILAIVVGALIVFVFWDPVLAFLVQPFSRLCERSTDLGGCEGRLVNTDPLAGITTRMRISGWGGIVLALPVLLWQIWQFVAPGLHKKEKKYAIPFIASSVVLFAMGATIAYVTLNKALEFLIKWAGDDVTPLYSVDKYVRLVTIMMFSFGAGFLFPVLLVFLQLVGVLTPRQLLEWWRQAIVLIIVVAAIITPSGDPFSLFALALPMWLFYFIAIGIGVLLGRRKSAATV